MVAICPMVIFWWKMDTELSQNKDNEFSGCFNFPLVISMLENRP